MSQHILFVCTGNICRSPMAEYLMRHLLGADATCTVGSAGTCALPGCPASEGAQHVLRELGLDPSPHRSRQLTADLIDAAELIVVMTELHREQIDACYPAAREKTHRLNAFGPGGHGGDVRDPIGSPVGVYRQVRDEIYSVLPAVKIYMQQHDSSERRNT